MRLIGYLQNEKEAFVFYSFLLTHGIHSTYETQADPEAKNSPVVIWVYEEDSVDTAMLYLKEFKANPSDARFAMEEMPQVLPLPPDRIAQQVEEKVQILPEEAYTKKHKRHSYLLTYTILFVCFVLYLLNTMQISQIEKAHQVDGKKATIQRVELTTIEQLLFFDYSNFTQTIDVFFKQHRINSPDDLKTLSPEVVRQLSAAEDLPRWEGAFSLLVYKIKGFSNQAIKGPLFEKISQGQVWRLVTPIFLHEGFLHVLFNMLWAWILLKQIEERMVKWKLIALIVILGIVSNTAQYLVSGASFCGFSGVVCGLVGFIWMKQKIAPWEGYPLQRGTILFLFIFVIAMFLLEVGSFAIDVFSNKMISSHIANTSHIVGGMLGILLGRFSFFSRGN